MNFTKSLVAGLLTMACLGASASFLGLGVEGQLSDPFTTQLFDNDTAVVGDGDEFVGYVSVGGGSTLQYYADIGESSVTIGIRHLGPFAIVLNGNAFTWTLSGLDAAGPVPGFELTDVFDQQLWPDAQDPNAFWIGWGQDTGTPPPWNPVWDPATGTFTVVASEGWTIPPDYDVFATFSVVVPVPAALPLMLSALGALGIVLGRRAVPA